MASQTPFFLADNVFDRINLYPQASLSAYQGSVPGREPNYIADYRRERSYWQASVAAVGQYVVVDLGAGAANIVDSIFIDRGHNIWGKTIRVLFSNDPTLAVYTSITLIVPALGTLGGDPTSATLCVTEEGALYSLFTASPSSRVFAVQVNDNMQPVFTG